MEMANDDPQMREWKISDDPKTGEIVSYGENAKTKNTGEDLSSPTEKSSKAYGITTYRRMPNAPASEIHNHRNQKCE